MKKKVLVSLVSAQTIPNIEFINEFKNEIDSYLFISTEFMESSKMNRTNCILEGADIIKSEYQIIIVKEDSVSDIEFKLANINNSDKYIVNLTGGTKMMSIATYNFFSKENAEIYYKPIRTNQIISVKDDSVFKEINNRIGVIDYLKSYGIAINRKTDFADFTNQEITKKIFNVFLKGKINYKTIERLRTKYRSKKAKYTIYDIEQTEDEELRIKELSIFLEKLGFENKTKEDAVITKKEIVYLTGGWFEEFIYFYFKEQLSLNNYDIELGVHLKKSETVLDNDLDVVFTYNNILYVIECKTAMALNEKVSTSLFNETIYKASALRAKFGLTVKNMLITLSNMTHPNIDYNERASAMNIMLYDRKYFIDMSKLNNLINLIKNTY